MPDYQDIDAVTALELLPEKIRLRRRALTEAQLELQLAQANPHAEGAIAAQWQKQVNLLGYDLTTLEERLDELKRVAAGKE